MEEGKEARNEKEFLLKQSSRSMELNANWNKKCKDSDQFQKSLGATRLNKMEMEYQEVAVRHPEPENSWEVLHGPMEFNSQVYPSKQGFGSGSGLDPDSIRSEDPESVFGIRIRFQEGKNDPQSRKKFKNFMFWSAGCSLLRAEVFFCNLNVLYGA